MNRIGQLTTARTIITEYTLDDLAEVHQLDSDPEVMRYLHGAITDIEKSEKDLAEHIDYYSEQPGLGIWKTCLHDGTHIGMSVLNRPKLSSNGLRQGPVQLGYRIAQEFWKQGFATEIALGMLDYGFKELDLPSVIAMTSDDNLGSIAVMEKVGMTYMGVTNEYYNEQAVWYQINQDD